MTALATSRRVSTRLIRKGALIEETYRIFQCWDLGVSIKENLERIQRDDPIGAGNQSWLREVAVTLSSRFQSDEELTSLVLLAQKRIPVQEWKAFLLWHVGLTDALYYHFATEWLFDCHQKGLHNLRSDAVVPFLKRMLHQVSESPRNLSEYGLQRGARDLLRMAADFGLLHGKSIKNFSPYQMPESAFLYALHALTETEPNCRTMIERPEWRLFLLTPGQVEREILNLHQFHKLNYQAAGSLAQLTLPCRSAADFVYSLVP